MGQSGASSTAQPTAQPTQPGGASYYGTIGTYALSGAIGAWSAYQSGKTDDKIARYNAMLAELQADYALNRGTEAANRVRTSTRRRIGSQRAAFASQGVVVDSGSAKTVVDQTAVVGEADAQQIKANALLEAWGYQVQANDARLRGALARSRGISDAAGSFLTAGARIGEYQDRANR